MHAVDLRETARRVLEFRGFGFVRLLLWSQLALKDGRATKSMARRFQIMPLDIYAQPFPARSKTKTLFILGGGDSVRELTRQQLAIIASEHSIGVNFWLFHDLVPSAYSFDAGHTPPSPEGTVRLRSIGRRLERHAVTTANPVVIYLRPVDHKKESLFPVPQGLNKQARIYGRANLITQNLGNLSTDLKAIIYALRWRILPSMILPDNGSSVVRLIFLGLALRYKDIVLVGVDLDARPHFFYHSDYASTNSEVVGLLGEPSGLAHETTETTHRPFDNRVFMAHLARTINEGRTSRVWLASNSSTLNASIPVYRWPNT